jgi:hypothetical protein
MSDFTRWEYRVVSVGTFWSEPSEAAIEEALNQIGDEGWEAFGVVAPHDTNRLRFIARRPLTGSARRRSPWPEPERQG